MTGVVVCAGVITKLMVGQRAVGVELCDLELHVLVGLEGLRVGQVQVDALAELLDGLLVLLLRVPLIPEILYLGQLCINVAQVYTAHILDGFTETCERAGCLLVGRLQLTHTRHVFFGLIQLFYRFVGIATEEVGLGQDTRILDIGGTLYYLGAKFYFFLSLLCLLVATCDAEEYQSLFLNQ